MQPALNALERPPERVRNGVKNTLMAAPRFRGLDHESRRSIAHALVRIAHAAQILEAEANGEPVSPPQARAMTAGEDFSGAAVNRVADTTRAILGAISFPRFVKELISGVFKAMVETNQQQLQQYVELTRAVSQSLEGFASLSGDDDGARRWLAERFPQSFGLEEPDPEDRGLDRDEEPEPLRLITLGTAPSAGALRAALGLEADAEVPSGGAESLVPFVRRSLARNKQQMLATMVQMGMQRIVIDSGRIHAAMRFHIDASSAAEEARRTQFDTRTTIGARASGGFGIWSASASVDSTIGYVEANDRQTREQLNASADLNSSVEIHFRTDQVPLDRIASSQTVERLRLNTLNPERELQIAQQSDAARINAAKDVDIARINRTPLERAGQVQATVPPPPVPPGGSNQGQQGASLGQQGANQGQQGASQGQQGASQGQQGASQGQPRSGQGQQGVTGQPVGEARPGNSGQQGGVQGQQGGAVQQTGGHGQHGTSPPLPQSPAVQRPQDGRSSAAGGGRQHGGENASQGASTSEQQPPPPNTRRGNPSNAPSPGSR